MATAKFIKILTAPNSGEEPISYDLNVVIITTGFTGDISYSSKELPKGAKLEGALLSLESDSAGGRITIIVEDKYENSASAETQIISFKSLLSDFSKNENLAANLKSTKENWNSIIGEEKKKDPIKDPIKGR